MYNKQIRKESSNNSAKTRSHHIVIVEFFKLTKLMSLKTLLIHLWPGIIVAYEHIGIITRHHMLTKAQG